jgi:two-component system, NtrC family, sensor kinase
MKCPRCQHENPPQAKFCLDCGAPVDSHDKSGRPASSYADVQGALSKALEQETATAEILRLISSPPANIQAVLDAVAKSAAGLCESFDAYIFRRDGERLLLAAQHGPIRGKPIGEFSLPLGRGTAAGRAVLDGQTVHITDIQAEAEDFPEGSEQARELGHRAVLHVPLIREAVAIGTIGVRRIEARPFTERQIAALQTFADQAVIAIENVRLFEELQARNRELTDALDRQTATGEILRVISSFPTDVQPVFDAIAVKALELCRATTGWVYRFDGELIHIAAAHSLRPEATVVGVKRFVVAMDAGLGRWR